jgi:hypothetical protein
MQAGPVPDKRQANGIASEHSSRVNTEEPSTSDLETQQASRSHSTSLERGPPPSTTQAEPPDTKSPKRQPSERKPPPGCDFCPICNRVFSLRLLAGHVDSCLISTESSRQKPAWSGRSGGGPQIGDDIVDLTELPGAFYTCMSIDSVQIVLLDDRTCHRCPNPEDAC